MREDWVECTLDELSYKITDGTHHKPNYTKGGVHFISVKDINNDTIDFSETKFISEEDHQKLIERCYPEYDDLLITKSGTIGRMAIVPKYPEFSLFVSVALIKNKKHFIYTKYLRFYLEYYLKSFSLDQAIKGGVLKNYHLEDLRLARIILAPLPEQRAIVKKIEALFSSLDAGIADLKKAQEQLKIYRQAVLKKAFEGELTKEWRSADIPKVPLKTILKLSSSKHKPEKEENIFYIGLEHIEKDSGKLANHVGVELISTVKNKFSSNNILYGKLRPYLNKVYLSKENGVCSTDILVFEISELVLGKYIHQFMLSREFVNDMSNNTSGVNLPRVSTKYIENYLVPLPSLEEQAQIVKEIEARLSVCDAVEKQIQDSLNQAEALRQSILKKAIEGRLLSEEELKLCKQAPDYEPASVLLEKIKAEKEANKLVKKKTTKKHTQ